MCWESNHIHQAALKHKHITKYLPAVHALTGCDPASYRVRIGKATALKVLMGGHHLIELDQHGADEDKLTSKATMPSLLLVTDPKLKYTRLLTVTICGSLKSWTLSGMDGMQAMMAQRRSEPHVQLVSLLHR